MPDGIQQYVKLENRLLLLAWLNSLFGYKNNRELLEDCKAVGEGFGADGRSYLYHHLVARGGRVQIPAADLERYDANIRQHLEQINRGRTEKITLRYFQHLAALCTEIVLDRLFHKKAELLQELNQFVAQRNAQRLPGEPKETPFCEEDLTKLAYWMATGSGKTLILHLNYYQFRHYNREPLDNILLITPNEGLSEQHLAELAASGIPAVRFDLNTGGLYRGDRDVVQVIEITKLVGEKRGSGVSVPVEAFEGQNLIFVDEGHKGSGGEAWRKYRDALGATGFTFEYSATFGQALSAARNDPLTAEYGKAIVFDYSYRYFYRDGFGKDFRILNLKEETTSEKTDLLLLGNLLSFYQQLRLYEEQFDALRSYNLEKPLWVFVGSTVNAVYTENKKPRSDVLTVIRFLHRFLNERAWAVETLEAVLKGKTGLVSPDGRDVFAEQFPFLREQAVSANDLYEDMLRRIFHAPGSGGLHLCEIKNSPGELGLKAAGVGQYFGVVYIGDVPEFKKLIEASAPELTLEQDAIARSLFERINRPDSGLHVLIGARKFMEGWNSWRVSSMGLLNIGRQEGSQIIQLFGRGVRLKGKDLSLKRSTPKDDPPRPQHLPLLETLNIFAVRADYMAQFRNYLEHEGIETDTLELSLPVQINREFLSRGLLTPRLPAEADFIRQTTLLLEPDLFDRRPSLSAIKLDLSLRLQVLKSVKPEPETKPEFQQAELSGGREQHIPKSILPWICWEEAYFELLNFKQRKGWTNLIIRPETPQQIIERLSDSNHCWVVVDIDLQKPLCSWADRNQIQEIRKRIQEIILAVLCRYTEKFYHTYREEWEEENLVYQPLDENDPNLTFHPSARPETKRAYVLKLSRSETQLVNAVLKLLENRKALYEEENHNLPRLQFARHLYQPLLIETQNQRRLNQSLQVVPPALVESEQRFVADLREYWEAEKNGTLAGKEIFLLRNLSRGKGISFFAQRNFYPDFILWIIDKQTQRIVFIEPHGMLHAEAYIYDEKARLHERLPALAKKIGDRSNRTDVLLDSFIISATPYDELKPYYGNGNWSRKDFAEKHILFQEKTNDYHYLEYLFRCATKGKTG